MPVKSVTLAPGVNAEITPALGQAQVIQSQLIRWKMAGNQILLEKLGGWQKFYPLAFGTPVRALHAWEGINTDTHLAVGCEGSLNVISSGTAQNITPRTLVTNPAVNFSTTSGSPTVTIVDAGITASVYDSIYLLTPVSIGGIVLSGAYEIASVVSGSSYTITAAANAASTVANGGAVPVFATTSGSPTITVTLDNHGEAVGAQFPVPTPTTVGGITLSGVYLVQTIVDADNFTITAASAASSTDSASMNGGDASIEYFIGLSPTQPSAGYGVGTYGTGAYGLGISPAPSAGNPITTTNWSLDNWGEVLLACPANGPLYAWSPDSGFLNATKVFSAPLVNGGLFVSNTTQILVAWASSISSVQDPLLVQWSDSGDYTNWTVSALTQAGNYRIPTGSRIVGGAAAPQVNIIWTDLDVWEMDYIEPPLVFGFNKLASNCGLIARHAYATVGSTLYWMGNKQFYAMEGGSVTAIPCPVWDFIFQDLDTNNLDKICCGSNNGFGEVTWYFPSLSGGTGEVDSYVKVNVALGMIWDFGRLQRTAWINQSVVGQPIGGDANGYVYQHEVSNDADGQPMPSSFSTGYFQIGSYQAGETAIAEGNQIQFVDWIIPDFRYGLDASPPGATLSISLSFTDYPGTPPFTIGPYNMTNTVSYIGTRLRARYASMAVGSSDLGSFWRMGDLKIRATPDGLI